MAKIDTAKPHVVCLCPTNDKLTARQKQILQMLVNGRAPKQIAMDLAISLGAVKKQLVKTRRKLGVSTRAEMIARAVARGDIYVFMGELQIEVPAIKSGRQLQEISHVGK